MPSWTVPIHRILDQAARGQVTVTADSAEAAAATVRQLSPDELEIMGGFPVPAAARYEILAEQVAEVPAGPGRPARSLFRRERDGLAMPGAPASGRGAADRAVREEWG